MSKETLKFLNELQQELLTQENDCQANPRFWVVAQYEWEITHPNYADKWIYIDSEGYEMESKEDVIEHLNENDYFIGCIEDDDDGWESFDEVVESEYGITYIPVAKKHIVKQNTMFLTKQECQDHIKKNHYHYNSTVHTYAMTAWRAPKVAKLIEILTNENWDELNEVIK